MSRAPTDRYASFDYCFNYFQSRREAGHIRALADPADLQLSCLHLGFYLASWGMYRGSTALLQQSVKRLAPVIAAIAAAPPAIWSVDADDYSGATVDLVFEIGRRLRLALPPGSTDTLVTKIMLGVFGCVPALDANFVEGFRRAGYGRASFRPETLRRIARFYDAQAAVIERFRVPTLDFDTGQPTNRLYSRAKVIDMIFFVEGGGEALKARP